MSRHILSLSHEQLTAFDLDAFVAHANALNQLHRETFTTPFPKALACEGCRSFRVDKAGQQELRRQLQSGAKRLQLLCPFPEVVDKVRQATAKKGQAKDPKVVLLAIEDLPQQQTSRSDRKQVATLLGLPEDQVPAVRLTWCHLSQGRQGELRELVSAPRAVPRPPHRGTPEMSPSPILRSMSEPVKAHCASLRVAAAGCCRAPGPLPSPRARGGSRRGR